MTKGRRRCRIKPQSHAPVRMNHSYMKALDLVLVDGREPRALLEIRNLAKPAVGVHAKGGHARYMRGRNLQESVLLEHNMPTSGNVLMRDINYISIAERVKT